MRDLLMLCHRIPYPPNKGEKIRAYNWLRGLAGSWRLHVGAFVDDPEDWRHAEALRELCADLYLRPLSPWWGKLRALAALPTDSSLSVAYYRDAAMQRWVENKIVAGMDAVLVYSSVMAQYVLQADALECRLGSRAGGGLRADAHRSAVPVQAQEASGPGRLSHSNKRRGPVDLGGGASYQPATAGDRSPGQPETICGRGVPGLMPLQQTSANRPRHGLPVADTLAPEALIADYVDVDSEKWRQYARAGGFMSPLYRIEGQRLATFERKAAERFHRVLFVSDAEAECFRRAVPALADRIDYLANGVDTDHFSPERDYPDPYAGGGPVTVFTGAMDYRPNVDAVVWYAREILPQVQQEWPEVAFWIVGSRPGPEVRRLGELRHVTVTGRVPDVRPYLAHAAAVVAPVRIARGVQNKVLEAMAMARPVVTTTCGLEGLDAIPGQEIEVADHAGMVAASVIACLRGERDHLGAAARHRVLKRYRWEGRLGQLEELLQGSDGPAVLATDSVPPKPAVREGSA